MGTITITATVDSAIALSYGNVTFTSTDSNILSVGYYADGLPYIVVPSGSISFDSITPAESTTPGGKVIHGASKNPAVEDAAQCWDQRFAGYSATKKIDVATDTFTAGDIIVKNISRDTSSETVGNTRHGMGEFAACYIVASKPAANAMSPAPIGWSGRGTPTAHTLTASPESIIATLHSTYTSSGQDIVAASTAFDKMDMYAAPGLALSKGGVAGFEYRVLAPYGYGATAGTQEIYGREIANELNYLVLGILTDAWTVTQAKTALIRLIQTGIALFDAADGVGTGYPTAAKGNGGHYQYALTPILWALKYTGRTAEITTSLRDLIPTNELWQPFAVTSAVAANIYTSHDSSSFSIVSRLRQITNIVGNTITLEEHGADSTQFDVKGHNMVLSTNSDVRTVATSGLLLTGGNRDIVVTDATGFSIGNDVYFTPTWAIQEGDHEWSINNPGAAEFHGTYNSEAYQSAQKWYGAVLTIRALSLYDASVFEPLEQYALRYFRANQPSATYDRNATSYGGDGNLHAAQWTRAFHADHAATIFPDWTAAAPTLSSSSPTDNATGVAVGANITLTFNESVRFGYGTITLRENNVGWADLEVFDFADPAVWGTGAGQISISGSTLTINPTADLTASREYAIQVGSGAITNLKYVPYAGIADDTTLSFTTA